MDKTIKEKRKQLKGWPPSHNDQLGWANFESFNAAEQKAKTGRDEAAAEIRRNARASALAATKQVRSDAARKLGVAPDELHEHLKGKVDHVLHQLAEKFGVVISDGKKDSAAESDPAYSSIHSEMIKDGPDSKVQIAYVMQQPEMSRFVGQIYEHAPDLGRFSYDTEDNKFTFRMPAHDLASAVNGALEKFAQIDSKDASFYRDLTIDLAPYKALEPAGLGR